MKVVVTGASGFVGSHLVPVLVTAGHDVSGVVEPGVTEGIAGIPFHAIDITLGDGINEIIQGCRCGDPSCRPQSCLEGNRERSAGRVPTGECRGNQERPPEGFQFRLSGKELGVDAEIVYTGLRPGEKLREELVVKGEDVAREVLHGKTKKGRYRHFGTDMWRRELSMSSSPPHSIVSKKETMDHCLT